MKYILMMNGRSRISSDMPSGRRRILRPMLPSWRVQQGAEGRWGIVSSEGLGWPDQARLVRAGSEGAPVTDGVFPESKEFLAGYLDHRRGKPGAGVYDCRAASRGARARRNSAEHAYRSAASA